jgi:hypothetical protein
MTFLVNHPDTWIGVPEFWPFPLPAGGEITSSAQWLDMLMAELQLEGQMEGHVRSVLTMVADRAVTTGSRHYVTFDGADEAPFIVQSTIYDESYLGIRSLREFAGVDDPEQVAAPWAEDYTSMYGVTGARCVRYLTYDEQLGSIYGRVDYVFQAGGQVKQLTSMQLDLQLFQRLLPSMEELCATVLWSED